MSEKVSVYAIPGLGNFNGGTLSMMQIAEVVANHFGLHRRDILKKTREATFKEPRQIAMYFCREHKYSFLSIAREFNFNHATVIYSCRMVTERDSIYDEYHIMIKKIRDKISLCVDTSYRRSKKLTEEDVRNIKKLRGHLSVAEVADRFKVSEPTIYRIYQGLTWRDIVA